MPLELAPIIEGNDAGETIVFVQGWPDDASLWDPAVAALRDAHRCVRVTLPNFGGDRTVRWGYTTTEDIVDALEKVVAAAGRGEPVTLVLHDWGCYWGHAVHRRRPGFVSRVAGLDASPHFKPSFLGVLGIVLYQGWLFWAFVLGGPIGDWMTRRFAGLAHAPAPPTRLNAWMNYPYRNIWADIFSGRDRKLLAGYWPTGPLLFVFGEKKPFAFHSAAWVDHVRKVGGEVVGLPCGHWVPTEAVFVSVLGKWLRDHPASAPAPAFPSRAGSGR